MFGFLRPSQRDVPYRQAYARCCSLQHQFYGIDSLVFLSYEAVFLYVCAVDQGICGAPPADAATCCRLRTSRRLREADDAAIGQFCSAFGMLLAEIKLDDDVRDESSLAARLARWRFRRRFRKARQYFSTLDPGFAARAHRYVAEHVRQERGPGSQVLGEYAEPTRRAFGDVFSLFARTFGDRSTDWGDRLVEIGRRLGGAIIAFDCAADWQQDRRQGLFNPLSDRKAVSGAYVDALSQLTEIGWMCQDAAAEPVRGAAVVRNAFQRVERKARGSAEEDPPRPPRLPRFRRWSVRRRGDCDCGGCDGCAGCDGCGGGDGGCAGGDGGCGSGDGCGEGLQAHICCCDCGYIPDCCGGTSSGKRQAGGRSGIRQKDDSALIGMIARTEAPLRPTGVIRVADKRFPARSASGDWIAADAAVVVTGEDDFGVLVQLVDPHPVAKQDLPPGAPLDE